MKKSVVFKLSKGFFGRGNNNYRIAANRVDKALVFAFRDRKTKKRENRSIWIQQINAATRQFGLPYSQFMAGVSQSNIALDRKMLANLAVTEPFSFAALTEQVRKVPTIAFRDVNANRMTRKDYVKYQPVADLPEHFKNVPGIAETNFAVVHQSYAKAEAKAEKVNADLIKAGKVAVRKHVPRQLARPRKDRSPEAEKGDGKKKA